MAGTTPVWALPYPQQPDNANVPSDIKALCDRLETLLTQIQTGTAMPGEMRMWGATALPNATQYGTWLFCDGSAVSRTTYATLFGIIGTTWGTGDGSTTFNLPDFRGRSPVGLGTHADVNALAKSDGLAVGNRRQAHKHTVGQPAISTPAVNQTGNVALSDPGHTHQIYSDDGPGNPTMALASGTTYHGPQQYGSILAASTGISVSAQPTFALAGAPVASGGTVGPQTGAEPTDTPAFTVCNIIIKT